MAHLDLLPYSNLLLMHSQRLCIVRSPRTPSLILFLTAPSEIPTMISVVKLHACREMLKNSNIGKEEAKEDVMSAHKVERLLTTQYTDNNDVD